MAEKLGATNSHITVTEHGAVNAWVYEHAGCWVDFQERGTATIHADSVDLLRNKLQAAIDALNHAETNTGGA